MDLVGPLDASILEKRGLDEGRFPVQLFGIGHVLPVATATASENRAKAGYCIGCRIDCGKAASPSKSLLIHQDLGFNPFPWDSMLDEIDLTFVARDAVTTESDINYV